MTRTIFSKLALSALMIATAAMPSVAYAQAPAADVSAADLAAAKKAFAEGKKLHDQGKLAEAVEKFQKSYMLSKNPVLLFNVAVTMDEAGMGDLAVAYYKKFLSDAPADNAQRPAAEEKLKALEGKLGTTTTTTVTPPTGTNTTTVTPPESVTIGPTKPAGTYTEVDFQHEVVDTAPPGKPLDVTAYVPPDSGWTVTLGYRTAGEGKFTLKPMKWRYKELVGRIPAPKMIGDAVQYYVEAKDGAGTVMARSGKATSPNLVTLEAGATPRFYPDINDDGDAKVTAADIQHRDDSDDPLHPNKVVATHDDEQPTGNGGMSEEPFVQGDGLMDVGSKKFRYARLGTTIVGAGLLAGSVVFYLQAGSNARALEDDSVVCGTPPCRQFDTYDQGLEDAGKRDDTLHKVFLGAGVVVGVVAGYYWYKTLKGHKHEARSSNSAGPAPAARAGHDEDARLDTPVPMPWVVLPVLGEGFAGASASVGF